MTGGRNGVTPTKKMNAINVRMQEASRKEGKKKSSIHILIPSKSNAPNRNPDKSSSSMSLFSDVTSVPANVVVVSSEVVVAPTLRIVGAIVECAKDGMGPSTETRFCPSGDGSSSKAESRPDSAVPPKAETEGETGPPCRRPNEE